MDGSLRSGSQQSLCGIWSSNTQESPSVPSPVVIERQSQGEILIEEHKGDHIRDQRNLLTHPIVRYERVPPCGLGLLRT